MDAIINSLSRLHLSYETQNQQELLERLDQDTKTKLYYRIWDMAGQPPGDPQWGEHNATSDQYRLKRAVAAVAKERFLSEELFRTFIGPEESKSPLFKLLESERAIFMRSVDSWTEQSTPNENRLEAAQRIKQAYDHPNQQLLNLSGLNLRSLPDRLVEINHLRQLNFRHNNLGQLPSNIGDLTHLESLLADNNNLTELPRSIGSLKRLRTISLSDNTISFLIPEISLCTKLENLYLANNNFREIPLVIFELSDLRILELKSNRIELVPARIQNLTNLKDLSLSNNPIANLPPEIGRLTYLEKLSINNMHLRDLPMEVLQITSLKRLIISRNRLTSLPANFGRLINLHTLSVLNNNLTELPASIGQLTRLRRLQIQGNQLTTLPETILDLPAYCQITLLNNPINDAVRVRLQEQVASDEYNGPIFEFDMAHRAVFSRNILEQNLTMLARITRSAPLNCENFSQELQSSLNRFLNRLCDVRVFQNNATKEPLARTILDSIALALRDETFRNNVFAPVIDGAAATCGDRVALAILHLEINQKIASCDRKNPHAMAHLLINGTWTLSMLEIIAQNLISTLRFVDPIETVLAFPVKLKERLNIPHTLSEMLFFGCSGVTEQNLNDAEAFVKGHTENEEARLAFLIQQPAWLECLEATKPAELRAIREAREQESETCEMTAAGYAAVETHYKEALIELSQKILSPEPAAPAG